MPNCHWRANVPDMRVTNTKKLRELVVAKGYAARETVACGVPISISTLNKLMAGSYGRVPLPRTRRALCSYFGVPEDELFPVDGQRSA